MSPLHAVEQEIQNGKLSVCQRLFLYLAVCQLYLFVWSLLVVAALQTKLQTMVK